MRSVISQSLPCAELIVVDDGSTDDGPEIVGRLASEYPIKFLHKVNGGQSSARNLGAAHAIGDLIALLDQDDIWYPNHLEALVQPFLEKRIPELGWVYSNLDEIDINGQMVCRSFLSSLGTEHPKRDVFSCLKQDMFILPSASLISLKAFREVGGFDENLSGYEDDDLFLRLFRSGFDNEYVDTPLSQWRIYDESSSYSSRMRQSRSIYARKLLAAYPDEKFRSRYYTCDFLLPRFYPSIAADCRTALMSGDDQAFCRARADLDFLSTYITPTDPIKLDVSSLLITAVIHIRNDAPFIEQALRSVMRQSLPPAEIIVLDDGYPDNGVAAVEGLTAERPIKILRRAEAGASSGRNYGVTQAKGDFIALLDQDDIWYPNHLERLAQPFVQSRSHPLGWTYSNVDEIDERGTVVKGLLHSSVSAQNPKLDLTNFIREDAFIFPSASLISRKAFQVVGGFDDNLGKYANDDLFLRIFQAGFDNEYVGDALSQRRTYQWGQSATPSETTGLAQYVRKLLENFKDDPSAGNTMGALCLFLGFFGHARRVCQGYSFKEPGTDREGGR